MLDHWQQISNRRWIPPAPPTWIQLAAIEIILLPYPFTQQSAHVADTYLVSDDKAN